MASYKKKTFQCEPDAIGLLVMIEIQTKKNHREYLTLCEVLVYGEGMAKLNISIANNTIIMHKRRQLRRMSVE